MKTARLAVWLGYALAAVATAATDPRVPSAPDTGLEPGLLVRVSSQVDPITLMGHVAIERRLGNRTEYEGSGGAYLRLFRELKLGYFFEHAVGRRYDADWKKVDGTWQWTDVAGRGENFHVFDLTSLFDLDVLPGDTWTGELKLRYVINARNSQETLRVRPGVNYFVLVKGKPFLRLVGQYELYVPLNYGVSKIYETWIYLAAFAHLSDAMELGLSVADHSVTWGSTSSFESTTGTDFKVGVDSIEARINVHYRFDP